MATTTTEATKTAPNGDEKQSQNLRHQEVGHKSLLQSDDLYQVSLSIRFHPKFSIQFRFNNPNLN